MSDDPYDVVNVSILNLLMRELDRTDKILDVGCWHGALGKRLLGQVQCIVDGVDINTDALDVAKENGYRKTFVVNLNNAGDIEKIDDRYDYIVFGDVLEHTVDPDIVLESSLKYLKPNGRVLVSLPNIGFLLYRLTHLLGRWNYQNSGIMDKTHLRFFTLKTMCDLFDSHDLVVSEFNGFVSLLSYPLALRLPLKWLAKVYPSMFAMQIIFELKRKSEV